MIKRTKLMDKILRSRNTGLVVSYEDRKTFKCCCNLVKQGYAQWKGLNSYARYFECRVVPTAKIYTKTTLFRRN